MHRRWRRSSGSWINGGKVVFGNFLEGLSIAASFADLLVYDSKRLTVASTSGLVDY